MNELLENITMSDLSDMLVNLSKLTLNGKKHIKKYTKLRKLHSEIIDSMNDYIMSDEYNLGNKFNYMLDTVKKEIPNLKVKLFSGDADDITIIDELCIYKNHPKLTSVAELYWQKKKYRNKEKIQMLKSMLNSHASLFKIVATDRANGYVTYEDVFTKKKYKVVDIAMSSTFIDATENTLYMYNRIITFEDISFATGIHCMMTGDNKYLKEFIKKHKYKNCSDFARCLLIYDISKKEEMLVTKYNNKY